MKQYLAHRESMERQMDHLGVMCSWDAGVGRLLGGLRRAMRVYWKNEDAFRAAHPSPNTLHNRTHPHSVSASEALDAVDVPVAQSAALPKKPSTESKT
jgi:hypothetical protein